MPLYEFVSPAGHTLLLHRPVLERDLPVEINDVVFRRRTVPSRISIGTGAPPETQSQRTWKGYRALEMAGKLDDRPGYLPAETVKRALLEPETPEVQGAPEVSTISNQ
jgi:hypothetical protein